MAASAIRGRLDHDCERLTKTSVAMVKWAIVGLMTRRLAPTQDANPGALHRPFSNTCLEPPLGSKRRADAVARVLLVAVVHLLGGRKVAEQ